MVRCKDGVCLFGLQYEMRPVLIAADHIWARHGQELVITSTWEGDAHSARSYHYYGYAVDLRTRYFGADQEKVVADELRYKLPEVYDVVLHPNSHIHVEYDVEKARRQE